MKNKKNTILLVIATITLITVVLGATFAYFMVQGGSGANIDTSIITGTTDLLSFSFGDEINIQANEENFAEGMPSLSDSTTGSAILRANDATNSATATYNIYLIIESNDFEYTTEEGTPELLLNVTDPNGNPVENITGLVHYEDGFDITTRTGGFLLVPDYEISATTVQTIQDWLIEVTFVNLDSDQNANTGKTLTGKLYITQDQMSSYELTQINNIESTTSYNSINATLDITNGSAAVSKYYYGIEEATGTRSAETVEYVESDSANYEFTNLKSNTEYTIYSYVVDENDIKSNIYSTNVTTSEYENPTIDNVTHSVTLNSITVNVTASGGSNNVSKYMYKIDDNDWIETETNSYTFTNLTDTTEYDIRIKVVDSEGYESTEYYEAITTEVYILPVVTSVNAETTWNSITLTPSGTNGTNAIDHYKYSINNGAYQTSNVFSSLNESTTYTIKVKAIDSIGRESNVYTLQVRTDTYALPTISVSTSVTTNSITVNVSATPGDGSIVSYHYSRDDGSNYTSSPNNSYTFDGLTSGTTYYLKVYVTDSNGRTSAVTSKTQATTYVNPSVIDVTASDITSDSITLNVTASGGSNNISRYYYSKDNGATWVNSTSSSYTFTGLNSETQYIFTVYVEDTAGYSSTRKNVSATTEKLATLADVCPTGDNLANCIKTYYNTYGEGTSGLYLHDGVGSYTNADQEAGDGSYRFSGANPNNYVCFGSDVATCPTDNLYRIIGVFGYQVKLIKYDFANKKVLGADPEGTATLNSKPNYKGNLRSFPFYLWSGSSSNSSNTWSVSTLNTNILNESYLDTLGRTWSSKIATTRWKVGGNTTGNIYDVAVKSAYQNEIVSPAANITYNAKVGLMYVSDYGYAASPINWNTNLSRYGSTTTVRDNNWMWMGASEWTISRSSDDTTDVFSIIDSGSITYYVFVTSVTHCVRPVFYLNSNVTFTGGTGTQTDPIRIA